MKYKESCTFWLKSARLGQSDAEIVRNSHQRLSGEPWASRAPGRPTTPKKPENLNPQLHPKDPQATQTPTGPTGPSEDPRRHRNTEDPPGTRPTSKGRCDGPESRAPECEPEPPALCQVRHGSAARKATSMPNQKGLILLILNGFFWDSLIKIPCCSRRFSVVINLGSGR